MASLEEKIRAIEEEIRRTPYNKATQHHIGRLKAKLAQLREEAEQRARSKGGGTGFTVKKSGDATVVLVGFPSVGKSTLLNQLTSAQSETAEYEFTTLDVVPGMLEHRGARIQILDVPGLIKGASRGRGRGREVLSAIRSSDLILFVLDVFNVEQLDFLKEELYSAGIRVNSSPPKVKITPRPRGGISISSTVELTKIDEQTIKAVLNEYRIHNAEVVIREDLTVDRLIDALSKNRVYIPAFVALNKIDLVDEEYLKEVMGRIDMECLPISAERGINIDKLKDMIYEKLNFIRVYMKPQGKKADLEEPMILVKGSTIADVAMRIHRDFKEKFRYARVWGKSVSFPGQRVGLEHVVEDGDIVSIVVRK